MYIQPGIAILKTKIGCRTTSFSIVLGIRIGRAADQPFHETASVLLSDQAFCFYFSFCHDVSFEFNSVVYCKCHFLWELADFVSFTAMSGTVVVAFVLCSNVLCDI